MKAVFEILKELIPLWLLIIALGFGYLIFLFTKIFNKTNQLAEKQSKFLQDRLDSVDKTTNIFERALNRQELDIKNSEKVIEELKERLSSDKESDLNNLDQQLADISKALNEIKEQQIDREQLTKLKDEIEQTKSRVTTDYEKLDKSLSQITSQSEIRHTESVDLKVENVFVIQPSSTEATTRYEIIKEVCSSLGLSATRPEELSLLSEPISDSIKTEIKKTDIIIADLSGNNPNVMYELGYAHALNKPVIILASGSDRLFSDVANYHILIADDMNKISDDLARLLSNSKLELEKYRQSKKYREILLNITDSIPLGKLTRQFFDISRPFW